MSDQALDKITNALNQLQAKGILTAKVVTDYDDLVLATE